MADPRGAEPPPEKKKRLDLKTKRRDRSLFSPPVSKQVAGDCNKTEIKSLNNPSSIKLSSSMLKVLYGSVLSNEDIKSFPRTQLIQSYEDMPTSRDPQPNLWTTLPSPDYAHLTRQKLHPLIMEPADKRGSKNLVSKLNNDFIAVSSNDISNKIPDEPVMKTGLSPTKIKITNKNTLDKPVIITSSLLARTNQTSSKLPVNKTSKSGVTGFSSSIQKTISQQGQTRRMPPSSTSLQVGVVAGDDWDDFDELVKDIDLSVYD